MTRRIRIPLVFDVLYVDEPDVMYRLNENRYVDRNATHRFSLANWIVHSRIYNLITARGAYFPVFLEREDPVRIKLQAELDDELTRIPPPPALVEKIASFVAGKTGTEAASIAVQNICGKPIDPDFEATPETVKNARIVSDYMRSGLLTKLLFLTTNKLRSARGQLWKTSKENRLLMHAITLGPQGVQRALERMSEIREDPNFEGKVNMESVVAQCLVPPSRLLRFSNNVVPYAEGCMTLRPGTLVVFLLKRVHSGTARRDVPFLEDTWSQCPAHAYIPRLLQEVWKKSSAPYQAASSIKSLK